MNTPSNILSCFPQGFRPLKGAALSLDPAERDSAHNLFPPNKELSSVLRPTAKLTDNCNHTFLASIKFDGIRALTYRDQNGLVRICSSKLKPIPNAYINSIAQTSLEPGLDGELVVVDGSSRNCLAPYHTTESYVMTRNGEPPFVFFVFDRWNIPRLPAAERIRMLCDHWNPTTHHALLVTHIPISNLEDCLSCADNICTGGHEGIMLRSATGLYKYGRATFNSRELLKVKPYQDAEATVVGYTELQHNLNPAQINELGLTFRTSHVKGKTGGNMLGALELETSLFPGVTFSVGTGFTEQERVDLWHNPTALIGRQVTFKYQRHGSKERPRQPQFKCFRDGSI